MSDTPTPVPAIERLVRTYASHVRSFARWSRATEPEFSRTRDTLGARDRRRRPSEDPSVDSSLEATGAVEEPLGGDSHESWLSEVGWCSASLASERGDGERGDSERGT